jgi:NADH-quinone oxidoreductase subunit F
MDWQNFEKVLLPDIDNYADIDTYIQHGGYETLRKVLNDPEMTPQQVTQTVKAANIKGRGGAGFNAGMKWSFMPPKKEGVPRYLAINGDESEPGTFKDRRIFEYNPHLFIEGSILACYAMEMDAAYHYIRGEYIDFYHMMQKAIDQAYERGFLGKNILGSGFDLDFYQHLGAGAYICGEETSLMESLEGKRGYPRSKPPFPAQYGLWGYPTTINNVETLTNVPLVLGKGVEWYTGIGAPEHPGPVLYGISGPLNRPGVYEYPAGMAIEDLIHKVAGGLKGGKKVKAVVPGGASVPVLRADGKAGFEQFTGYEAYLGGSMNKDPDGNLASIKGVTMNAASLGEAGSSMGTAGMLVLPEGTDMVYFAYRVAKFFDHESCGQCTPCREGTGWLTKLIGKFMRQEAKARDMDLLLDLTVNMEGRTICALADAAAWPVRGTLVRFRDEFEACITRQTFAVKEAAAV